MGRGAELGEPPALDAGEPLADGVDLGDVRAAGQHLAGDALQLRQRHQRALKQGGAASGHQKQHAVPCAEAADPPPAPLPWPGRNVHPVRDGPPRKWPGRRSGPWLWPYFVTTTPCSMGAAQRVVSGLGGLPPGFADGDQHRPPLTGGQAGPAPAGWRRPAPRLQWRCGRCPPHPGGGFAGSCCPSRSDSSFS